MSEQACERLKGNRAETADNRQKIPRIHSKEITAADPRWRAGAADHQSGRDPQSDLALAEKAVLSAARRLSLCAAEFAGDLSCCGDLLDGLHTAVDRLRAAEGRGQAAVEAGRIARHGACKP